MWKSVFLHPISSTNYLNIASKNSLKADLYDFFILCKLFNYFLKTFRIPTNEIGRRRRENQTLKSLR